MVVVFCVLFLFFLTQVPAWKGVREGEEWGEKSWGGERELQLVIRLNNRTLGMSVPPGGPGNRPRRVKMTPRRPTDSASVGGQPGLRAAAMVRFFSGLLRSVCLLPSVTLSGL